jgi:hypothetical protein
MVIVSFDFGFLQNSFSEATMLAKPKEPRIPLPKNWQGCVKSAVLHAIALAHYAIVYARAWAADSINARVRLSAENDRLHEECALLREELRIKDTRIARIAPQRRPHYGPHERMAILELRAARGWSLKQTGDTFLVTPATIVAWVKRIDDQGADALLQLREPVNKFPDFVRYIDRATSENSVPHHGEGQDRRDTVPGRASSGCNDGWADLERRPTA